ncbi:MAG: hypothetical protein R3242_02375, partial [Akkermansiaceae bacterium]|nr:hypothetical protein [Akkermansiaceae bacterium]
RWWGHTNLGSFLAPSFVCPPLGLCGSIGSMNEHGFHCGWTAIPLSWQKLSTIHMKEVQLTKEEAAALKAVLKSLAMQRREGKWDVGVAEGIGIFLSNVRVSDEEKAALLSVCEKVDLKGIQEI